MRGQRTAGVAGACTRAPSDLEKCRVENPAVGELCVAGVAGALIVKVVIDVFGRRALVAQARADP